MKKNDDAPESVEPKPHNQPVDIGIASGTALKKKEPYVKPAFRCEKVSVTSALSCGKIIGGNVRGLQGVVTLQHEFGA